VDSNKSNSYENSKCYAVKVRSRGEEVIANTLRAKHYEVLLPSYTALRRYSDRTRKVSCVLFTGYVFVRMNPENMLNLVSTVGVSYVVRSASGLLALSEAETRTIETLCQANKEASIEPCSYLRVGQRVRIETGPLIGLEGVLVRVRDMERVIVSVETLHSAVSIEIGHTRVRAIDTPPELTRDTHAGRSASANSTLNMQSVMLSR
jgi:transcription antitermination factor NusG